MSDSNTEFISVIRGLSLVRLQRAVRLGVKSLWLHRLRSLLTVLGIVFGVCSVIAMLAIGEGASFEAQEQIKSLGSQNIIVRSVKPPEEQKISDKASQSYVLAYGIARKDAERIRATIPGVTVVLPARNIRDYVWNISRRVDCDVCGTVPWYPEMRNQRVAQGRFFTETDMDAKASVCVLSAGDGAGAVPAGIAARQTRARWCGLLPSHRDHGGASARGQRPTTDRCRTNRRPIACSFRWTPPGCVMVTC